MGEGFGIPVIEAQACGTPVIVSNFTAQPELVGDGWAVDGQPWWDPLQGAFFIIPNVASIVNALEDAYRRERGTSQKAVEFAKQYEADAVYDEYWKPAMKEIAAWCRSSQS
jgi:glycosyltransferase involved in cell wall biosynthesis